MNIAESKAPNKNTPVIAYPVLEAAPAMLQALREVEGDCYYLADDDRSRCGFCQQLEGTPHDPECTMHFVLAALAKAEGR